MRRAGMPEVTCAVAGCALRGQAERVVESMLGKGGHVGMRKAAGSSPFAGGEGEAMELRLVTSCFPPLSARLLLPPSSPRLIPSPSPTDPPPAPHSPHRHVRLTSHPIPTPAELSHAHVTSPCSLSLYTPPCPLPQEPPAALLITCHPGPSLPHTSRSFPALRVD